MSNRQRYYVPAIADITFDKLIKKLEKRYKITNHSQLITHIVMDAANDEP